jgi:apolipoprotein N-acyltransferase
MGLFGAGVSWVYISLAVYGNMMAWLAALATLLFCLVLALFPAVVGALQARCAEDRTTRLLLMLPTLWVLLEWTRGWLFTGFPWLAVGYSQVPHSPLAGFAPLLGVYGVSLLMALAAGLLVWTAQAWRNRAHLLWGVCGLAALLVSGQALRQIDWTTPVGKPTSVALLQGNIPQDLKWQPEKIVDTLLLYARMAEAHPAQLIVMPETALPLFESELPAEYRERLDAIGPQQWRRRAGGPGDRINLWRLLQQRHELRQRARPDLPQGTPGAVRRVHSAQASVGMGSEGAAHSPVRLRTRQHGKQPMNIGGQRVAANICYEDVFGEEIIRQLPEATVLVNMSNLAWFGDSLSPWQHAQISQMRALETGRMMLRATNTGVTAIIDVKGYQLAFLPLFTEGVLKGDIQGYAGATPYVLWGNLPVLIGCFGLLGFAVIRCRFRRRP